MKPLTYKLFFGNSWTQSTRYMGIETFHDFTYFLPNTGTQSTRYMGIETSKYAMSSKTSQTQSTRYMGIETPLIVNGTLLL